MDRNDCKVTVQVADLREFPINTATSRIVDNGIVFFTTKVGVVRFWSRDIEMGENELAKIDSRFKINKGVD